MTGTGTGTGGVSFMVMHEDESVDVRFGNGARLQLSPCGCEFVLVRPAGDPTGHPLQPAERVRQRSRFTVSTNKELMVTALTFRNKYASRPYLPEEIIPAEHKKPFFSIDSDVLWPELSSCDAEFRPGGETIVRSEEGRAVLTLSPSGEEFSVEFTCGLSRSQTRHQSTQGSPGSQQQPEVVHQSNSVIQHHSCALSPPPERRSQLPRALPLTCASPHWHRWKVTDSLDKKAHTDQDLPAELVKVMWCHGVTYRILSGAVTVVEISPGDGSVIRSNGVLDTYFIHHKPELLSGQVKEVTYHLNNLPPDVPGQLYSVCSIVSRASRILTCYNEAKQSLKLPATPSCLQEGFHFSKPAMIEENLSNRVSAEQHVNVRETAESRSDLVAAELEKIKRFNFLLENNHLLRTEKRRAEPEGSHAEEAAHEAVSEDCIAEALRRTSKAIQDIDALISATTPT
ncbi:putative protein C5orf34-like protein [Larimichthys crocea]|uniref:Uncharacterized protein n=1 Tax=Larimichthys crocea TaxID=215358 RepID=A0A6G0IM55_LARCR|nr:putative protein C5orf34-like protein [Larimichthys crocea]